MNVHGFYNKYFMNMKNMALWVVMPCSWRDPDVSGENHFHL
jgi:hypothetical protein